MSKKFVKNLEDRELICYVCRKKIKCLDKLREYLNKRLELTRTERYDLQDVVTCYVVPVVVREDLKKVFRHSRCNPRKFKPKVEDL